MVMTRADIGVASAIAVVDHLFAVALQGVA